MNHQPLGHSQVDLDGRVLGDTATSDGAHHRPDYLDRFGRAQARNLFAWRKCDDCGELHRAGASHECGETPCDE